MPRLRLPAVICFGVLLSLSLSSCFTFTGSTSSTDVTDTIAEYSRKAIFESREIEQQKMYPESKDLLGNSALVFSVFITKDIPLEMAESLHRMIGQKLQNSGLYLKFVDETELNTVLGKNNRLAQAKDIYLDSLTLVSVSDKDISNPLGRYLNTQNFLVFQVDRWPCQNCTTDKWLRMKLRLIDAESSHIVWTGIAEKRKLTDEETADIDHVSIKLAETLVDTFYHQFKKKWHRQRFDNLSKLVS